MKTKICFFFLFLILILSFSSAVEFNVKEEVLKGENLVVKVVGEFTKPITADNVYFQKRHLSTSIEPYHVEKINGDYYIYAKIPFEKEADNYSVWLRGTEYYSGIGTSTDDLFANFTILPDYVSFSLDPGIIQTTENYFIEIRSLSDSTISVNYGDYEFNEDEETIEWENVIELKPGETKTLEFPLENFIGLKKINFNYEDQNYEVFVFMDGSEYIISKIINESLNISEIENLSEINVTILDNGSIIINDSSNNNPFADNCSMLDGEVCEEGSDCEGNVTYTKVDTCCLGECVVEEPKNTGKTIGWILIIVIVLFLTWFFKKKYRGTRPPAVDLEKASQGKKK